MMTYGEQVLREADWLLGFDFDGTLADVDDAYSVSRDFFQTLERFQTERKTAWGICTGRSLEFLMEGITEAHFPALPDYIVAQERDVFYLNEGGSYTPDEERNERAHRELKKTLHVNAETLKKVADYVTHDTRGEWVSIPGDPAGIIATDESEIQAAVDLFHACSLKTPELDYQRNTIYLRLTHKGYCKGTAVNYLQKHFQIPHGQTLVMGDNYNDLTMLNAQVAAHYGGPANSIPTLKKALLETGGFITEARCALGVSEALRALLSV